MMSDDLHPSQTFFTHTFERSWSGPWLPDSRPENLWNHVFFFHLLTDLLDLCWSLGGARSCDGERGSQSQSPMFDLFVLLHSSEPLEMKKARLLRIGLLVFYFLLVFG